MSHSHQNLIGKVLLIGFFIAALIFLFHPGVGQINLVINGEPVAEPLARLAAIPTLLLALAITTVLGLLLFFGVGLFIFLTALLLAFLALVLVAPYFWPILAIILLVILISSIGNSDKH